jgi:type VI secretion system protein ImpJ
MDYNKPISWEQGLFLQPQHFQIADLLQQKYSLHLSQLTMPFLWGIQTFEIDEALLANNIFSLSTANMIFPDGAITLIPENTVFLSRPFVNAFSDKTELTVYVGIKNLQSEKPNVTVTNNLDVKDVETRFICVNKGEDVNDLYYSGPQASIKNLQFVMRVFFDTEIANVQKYSLIPLAKLIKNKDKTTLDKSFISACVLLSGDSNLQAMLQDFYDDLTNRARELESYKHNWNSYQGQRNVPENMQLLQTLSRYLTELRLMLLIKEVQPYTIYVLLTKFFAELSIFVPEFNLIGENTQGQNILPSYLHDNLSATFNPIIKAITTLLNIILLGSQNLVHAVKEGRYFVATPHDAFFLENKKFYLLISGNDDKTIASLQSNILSQSKLCTYSDIEKSVEYAVPGVGLTALSAVPANVPNIPNCLYFTIDSMASEWLKITKEQKIGLYLGNITQDLTITLAATEE